MNSLIADKLVRGTWGNGSWKGNNLGDYSGFYFDGTRSQDGSIQGEIYLDSNNDGAYDFNIDPQIGTYISRSDGSGARSGDWVRFSGSSNGAASGVGVNATFVITAPLQFNTIVPSQITSNWFDSVLTTLGIKDLSNVFNFVDIGSWSATIKINRIVQASDSGDILDGKQKSDSGSDIEGSILCGGKGSDRIQGKAGWDIADGREGNDLVKTGNGRDILTGGLGSDELWGGFGWNTYKSDRDGSQDLVVIKSDQWQVNPQNGKAGNNADGSKCDMIEALDSIDKIIIQGVNTSDLSFASNVTGQGLSGIGIYAKGALEALYTGGDLTVAQLTLMTTGDITGPSSGTYWNW